MAGPKASHLVASLAYTGMAAYNTGMSAQLNVTPKPALVPSKDPSHYTTQISLPPDPPLSTPLSRPPPLAIPSTARPETSVPWDFLISYASCI